MDRDKLILWMVTLIILIDSSLAADISGRIVDESGDGLPRATIAIPELNTGAYTNDNGFFSIRGIPQGVYQLKVTYIGKTEKMISIVTGEEVNVALGEDLIEIEEVVVTAQRPSLQPVIELTKSADSRIYGNSYFSYRSSIPLKQNEVLNIRGDRSVYSDDDFEEPIERQYMKWYIGVPKQAFDEILLRNDELVYRDIYSLLSDYESDNPTLVKEGVDNFGIQLTALPSGQYYIILKITNPYNFLLEQFTWHQINLYPPSATEEEIARDILSTRTPTSVSMHPRNFQDCASPRPIGTTCHNGKWAPILLSNWRCVESENAENICNNGNCANNIIYNNPSVGSKCKITSTGAIKSDICGCLVNNQFSTTCPSGFTHVGEFSCNDNCASPIPVQCPEGSCVTIAGVGTCSTSIPELDQPEELPSTSIIEELTEGELLESALCNSIEKDGRIIPFDLDSLQITSAGTNDNGEKVYTVTNIDFSSFGVDTGRLIDLNLFRSSVNAATITAETGSAGGEVDVGSGESAKRKIAREFLTQLRQRVPSSMSDQDLSNLAVWILQQSQTYMTYNPSEIADEVRSLASSGKQVVHYVIIDGEYEYQYTSTEGTIRCPSSSEYRKFQQIIYDKIDILYQDKKAIFTSERIDAAGHYEDFVKIDNNYDYHKVKQYLYEHQSEAWGLSMEIDMQINPMFKGDKRTRYLAILNIKSPGEYDVQYNIFTTKCRVEELEKVISQERIGNDVFLEIMPKSTFYVPGEIAGTGKIGRFNVVYLTSSDN